MNRKSPHRCPDCGAPTDQFLCERCAEVCENLTASGEYYRYWVHRYRPGSKETKKKKKSGVERSRPAKT